jgi:hypothetical protein
VDVQLPRDRLGVAAVLQPGQQGLGEHVPLAGAQFLQRPEPGRAERVRQLLVGEDHHCGQMVGAAYDAAGRRGGLGGDPALGQRQRLPGPAQRAARPGERHGGPDGAGPATQPAFDHLRPARAVRIGHQQARVVAGGVHDDVRRQRRERPEVVVTLMPEGHGGDPARQGPLRRPGQLRDRLGGGGRIGDHQAEQAPPTPFQLAGHLGARGRETLGAGAGQLVEVEEDRLAHPGQHVGIQRRLVPCLRAQAPPRDPGPEPQCRLQRLEVASLGGLDAADLPEYRRGLLARRGGVRDPLDELLQRVRYRAAHGGTVRVIQRPRVLRYPALDGVDHFLGHRGELGQHHLGRPERHTGPWRGSRSCRSSHWLTIRGYSDAGHSYSKVT